MSKGLVCAWLPAVCLVCGCAQQQSAQPQSAQPQSMQPQSVKPAVAWVPFTSAEGRFSVLMPGTPAQSQESEAAPGGRVVKHIFRVKLKEPREVLAEVTYKDLPGAAPRDPRKLLREGSDPSLTEPGERILERRDITLGPYPGVEMVMAMPPKKGGRVMVRGRIFLVGRRVYEVHLAAFNPVASDSSKFFNSFKITPERRP